MAKVLGPFLASREKPALSLFLPTWKGAKQKQALDVSLLVSPSKREIFFTHILALLFSQKQDSLSRP